MRIFLCGFIWALAVSFGIMIIFSDMPTELSDVIICTAFVCGGVSQAIKQVKE